MNHLKRILVSLAILVNYPSCHSGRSPSAEGRLKNLREGWVMTCTFPTLRPFVLPPKDSRVTWVAMTDVTQRLIDKVCLKYYDEGYERLRIEKMQIKKTYQEVNPELLYNEIKDFTLKQGAVIDNAKMETYSLASDSSSFTSRGTLTFKMPDTSGKAGKECLSAHIVGSAKGETKLLLDIDENLFPPQKVTALQDDLDFVLGSYEVKPG